MNEEPKSETKLTSHVRMAKDIDKSGIRTHALSDHGITDDRYQG